MQGSPSSKVAITAALGLLAVVLATLGAAGASTSEIEPNDSVGQATPIGAGDEVTGTCDAAGDFLATTVNATAYMRVNFIWQGAGLATLTVFNASERFLNPHTLVGAATSFGFTAPAAGNYTLQIECGDDGSPWTAGFGPTGETGWPEGADEWELNGVRANASVAAPNSSVRGTVHNVSDAVDYWFVPVDSAGSIRLTSNRTWNYRDGLAVDNVGFGAQSIVVANVTPPGLTFAFFAQTKRGAYSVTIEWSPDVNMFVEGPGETEPNNDEEGATVVPFGSEVTLEGLIGGYYDGLDIYRLHVPQYAFVTGEFVPRPGCISECSSFAVIDSNGSLVGGQSGYFDDERTFSFGAAPGTTWYFVVNATYRAGSPYTLSIRTVPWDIGVGSVVEFVNATLAGIIDSICEPHVWNTNTTFPMLHAEDEDVLWGQTLDCTVVSRAPIDLRLRVLPGTTWETTRDDRASYIVMHRQEFPLPAANDTKVIVNASALRPEAKVPGLFEYYYLWLPANGTIAKVVDASSKLNYSSRGELCALWVATAGLRRADLIARGATTDDINEGVEILRAAGFADSDNALLERSNLIEEVLYPLLGAFVILGAVIVLSIWWALSTGKRAEPAADSSIPFAAPAAAPQGPVVAAPLETAAPVPVEGTTTEKEAPRPGFEPEPPARQAEILGR